ncbi:hypothetical protein EOK75_17155 (plasmid) [Pseudorhodobacter turbinis]|uniref:Uncharacterized protein n=2 Tax=Pseudorhodobacter turbinis TaxID=2500533 RepID=A0A4P8EKM1_9RHOB|nr:hypothetical protein EOK75_17155 [Pseudorhodobacter turbinis]
MQMGLWGPYGEQRNVYYQLAKFNEIAEILRATALGKRFKATPFSKFHEIFPIISEAESLGRGAASRKIIKQNSMATNAINSLGGDMPAWIKAKL